VTCYDHFPSTHRNSHAALLIAQIMSLSSQLAAPRKKKARITPGLRISRAHSDAIFISLYADEIITSDPKAATRKEAQTSNDPDATDSLLLAAVRNGVNLKFIKHILAHVEKKFNEGYFNVDRRFEDGTVLKPVDQFEDLTTTHVVYLWVKDKSVTADKRLVDCPDAFKGIFDRSDVGKPTYFISHAWKGSFKKLMTEVLAFLTHASETDTYVWMDMWAVNQHDHTEEAKRQNKADVGAFDDVVEVCKAGTVVVVDAKRCNPSSRLWCIFE
jgi:hypothetical protein